MGRGFRRRFSGAPAPSAAQSPRDLLRGHYQGLVEVDVALCDASSGVTKEAGDGQLGETHIASYAGEGVPQDVGVTSSNLAVRQSLWRTRTTPTK